MEECKTVDPGALFLLNDLSASVLRAVGVRKDFQRLLPRLQDDFKSGRATPEKEEIVRWLWPVFRPAEWGELAGRARISMGQKLTSYVGYYFLDEKSEGYGWYGFISPSWIRDGRGCVADGRAMFVVITDFDVPGFASDVCESVIIKDWDGEDRQAWWLKFDASWNDKDHWQGAISPLLRAVSERRRPVADR